MSKFIVNGGKELHGEVKIAGSKNSALAVLSACLLVSGQCEIENVPDILDVRNFLEILKSLGAKTQFENHKVTVDTSRLENKSPSADQVGKLRGSILLLGSLLARFGYVKLPYPGGDAIGSRPIDVHLDGFRKLGAQVNERGGSIEIQGEELVGNRIVLGVTSVTGTENLILASVQARNVTEIRMAATEPHVQDLCRFLNKTGARIEGVGTPSLRITGVEKLEGTSFKICPDEIEAVTFCVAAAATRSELTIINADLQHLDAPLSALDRMGVKFIWHPGKNHDDGRIEIKKSAAPYHATKIITGVFPQLLTDEQPMLGVLATQAEGETSIHDWIYEGRQGYLKALVQLGAKVEFDDVHRARITGLTPLHGAEIKTPDLRAGASVLIAALVATGESIIYNAEIIDRGYERLDERLNNLGADIRRV